MADPTNNVILEAPAEDDSSVPVNEAFMPPSTFAFDLRNELGQELQQARQQPVPSAVPVSMPSLASRPVNEWDLTENIARKAFPCLFPYGRASISESRQREVDVNDYYLHLLRYKDGRFARHPQFRYWVFNTKMRMQAKTTSRWLWKQSPDKLLTADELYEALKDPQRHVTEIVASRGKQIRGTRTFWREEKGKIEAIVKSIGCPALFFTLSAADQQWADLYEYLPDREAYFGANDNVRHQIARRLTQENPHIIAEYLTIRFGKFFTEVLKRKFNLKHHWYRYEWQARGSGHLHGFLWIEDAPSVENLQDYLNKWGDIVVAINPCNSIPQPAVHPCSRRFADRNNTQQELAEILNRCQRHTKCAKPYCIRMNRITKQEECRFHFPWPCRPEPDVTTRANPAHPTFEPARNDPLLGKYNPLFTMAWLANTDVAPTTNIQAVMAYLTNYVSKEEKKSASFIEISEDIFKKGIDRNHPLRSYAHKFFNALIGERDYSAQEIVHSLIHLPFVETSVKAITLDIREVKDQRKSIQISDEIRLSDTAIERYCKRSVPVGGSDEDAAAIESMTLLDSVTKFTYINGRGWRPLQRATHVARIIPLYKEGVHYRDYCRGKLMLHHPFRDALLQDLLTVDGVPFEQWENAYEYCCSHHQHPPDPLTPLPPFISENDDLESLNTQDMVNPDDARVTFEEIAQRRPHHDGELLLELEELGSRPVDWDYNWLHRSFDDDVMTIVRWGEQIKYLAAEERIVASAETPTSPDILNARQREVFDTVLEQSLLRSPQLLLQIDGEAGTGKSKVIDLISQHLAYEFRCHGVVIRAAPTGVAAHAIHGSTIHSLFSLPISKRVHLLERERLSAMQEKFKDCKLIIIDEKSMIGLNTLNFIDSRLRQIRNSSEEPFGGISILLCGDFGQLRPVGTTPLFMEAKQGHPEESAGQLAYSAFNKSILLDEIVRQQGTNHEDALFRKVLQAMRDGHVDMEGWQLLVGRTQDRLDPAEFTTFDDALRLFYRNKDVTAHNLSFLRQLGRPVLKIKAVDTGDEVAKANPKEHTNLEDDLLLCHGAKVMIRRNLCTEAGLVNGTIGIVHSILWYDTVDDPSTMPAVILLEIPGYEGKCCSVDNQELTPIVPVTSDFDHNGKQCTRKQFPLCLAWAMTIHKSQGVTADRAVVDLSGADSTLAYVALSRVRSIKGLVITHPIPYSQFSKGPSFYIRKRIEDLERRYQNAEDSRPAEPDSDDDVGYDNDIFDDVGFD